MDEQDKRLNASYYFEYLLIEQLEYVYLDGIWVYVLAGHKIAFI